MIQNSFPPNSIPSTWPTDKSGNIVLLRTVTGDDVIAETIVEADTYLIKNPLVVQGVQLSGPNGRPNGRPRDLHILLIPWNPLASVFTQQCICIDRAHILFTTTIDTPLQDYYRKCVEQSSSMIKNSQLAFGVSERVINMMLENTDHENDQNDDEAPHTFH